MLKNKVKRIIFDADDTLWPNNKFYMDAERDLTTIIKEAGHDNQVIKDKFDSVEKKVVATFGYGSNNFIRIMKELYDYFLDGKATGDTDSRFRKIVQQFEQHPYRTPQFFPDVIETMNILKQSYDLYILTKGNYQEQNSKLELSGIDQMVIEYFIPPEKDDAYYKQLLEDKGWNPETTCMVGNSPKSDINPALRQGMYAILIPYEFTWKLDNEAIAVSSNKFFKISGFGKLTTLL